MTLGNYHLTYHVFDHVTSQQLWDHMIYKHMTLGKYHMTYPQVATQSPDQARFRHAPSLLIGMWKIVGMINKSTNQ